MQTFLPYADFERTAAVLDGPRLGKQRVEVLQICNALHKERGGWVNHPVTRMWRGYEPALVAYGLAIVRAWTAQGKRTPSARSSCLTCTASRSGHRTNSRISACCPPGSAERTYTWPIARRSSGKTRTSTVRCSPMSSPTSSTSGPSERQSSGGRARCPHPRERCPDRGTRFHYVEPLMTPRRRTAANGTPAGPA